MRAGLNAGSLMKYQGKSAKKCVPRGELPGYSWATCPPMNPGGGDTTVPLALVEVSIYGMYYGVAGLNR
jgi:hypothetical protein